MATLAMLEMNMAMQRKMILTYLNLNKWLIWMVRRQMIMMAQVNKWLIWLNRRTKILVTKPDKMMLTIMMNLRFLRFFSSIILRVLKFVYRIML